MKDNAIKIAMILLICGGFGWFVQNFAAGSPKDSCTITLPQITGEQAGQAAAKSEALAGIKTVYAGDMAE